MADNKHCCIRDMPFMLTKFHGRREHGSLADGPLLPQQSLLVLSLMNRLM